MSRIKNLALFGSFSLTGQRHNDDDVGNSHQARLSLKVCYRTPDLTRSTTTSKSASAAIFRQRLEAVIARSGENVSAFARSAGIDRSTLAQFLSGDDLRLPRADTLVAVAARARVSTDWLLGLSQREEVGAEIIKAMLQIEQHRDEPADDQFGQWLTEAEGHRIRTVPVALPDFLKTEALLRFEYGKSYGTATPAKRAALRARLDFMCSPDSDVEVCMALQSIQSMAAGQDRWEGFSAPNRLEQIRHMARIYAGAYPGLRIYLYDLHDVYSVPFTVFGPKRAVIFLGPSYLVLNGPEHIRMFARRFDDLIRLAVVQPHDVERRLLRLADQVA